MDKLQKYIDNAPRCLGVDGYECDDYRGRGKTGIAGKYPNKYCAILVDYDTGLHYYDDLCESCRLKYEINKALGIVKSGRKYHHNPRESIDINTTPIIPTRATELNTVKTKNFCNKYRREKRKRVSDDDEDQIIYKSKKTKKIDDDTIPTYSRKDIEDFLNSISYK